jgi:hypothetical protein
MWMMRIGGTSSEPAVGERGAERLAGVAVGHLLVERGADALRHAADDLAVDDHRVEQQSAVLDHHVVEDVDRAGVGVDRRGARRIAERPRRTPAPEFWRKKPLPLFLFEVADPQRGSYAFAARIESSKRLISNRMSHAARSPAWSIENTHSARGQG